MPMAYNISVIVQDTKYQNWKYLLILHMEKVKPRKEVIMHLVFIQQFLMEHYCLCLGYIQGCKIPSCPNRAHNYNWSVGEGQKINTNIISKLYGMLESHKCYQEKKKKLEQSKGDQEFQRRGGGSDRSQCYIGQISLIEKLRWQQNLKAMRELSKCIFKERAFHRRERSQE